MSEPHEIKTIAELVSIATPENLDGLMADLKDWISLHAMAQPFAPYIVVKDVFLWRDDDKRGVTEIRIELTRENTDDK